VISAAGRVNPGLQACKSHRPVHGFKAGGAFDMEKVAPAAAGSNTITRCTESDLLPEPPKPGEQVRSLLDWVGRNHGTGKPGERKTNFLYVDGHVETKHVRETVRPTFEWGHTYYSLATSGDVQVP
jgi:prepilin-type processing-associated H-X9-DG protein